jgi:hypothetical protein
VSVSGASMSQKGPAIFQEPGSFIKVQFQAQEIFNVCLILEFEVKLLKLIKFYSFFNKKYFFYIDLCRGLALEELKAFCKIKQLNQTKKRKQRILQNMTVSGSGNCTFLKISWA